METGGTFNATAAAVQQQVQLSPSPSPIPYLFGGLASMIGLVALALMALACSYWRCFRYLEGELNRQSDLENPDEKPIVDSIKVSPDLEEKIVVIMPGEEKPRFLANPISSKASSFTDQSEKSQSQEQGHKNQNHATQNQENQDHQNL